MGVEAISALCSIHPMSFRAAYCSERRLRTVRTRIPSSRRRICIPHLHSWRPPRFALLLSSINDTALAHTPYSTSTGNDGSLYKPVSSSALYSSRPSRGHALLPQPIYSPQLHQQPKLALHPLFLPLLIQTCLAVPHLPILAARTTEPRRRPPSFVHFLVRRPCRHTNSHRTSSLRASLRVCVVATPKMGTLLLCTLRGLPSCSEDLFCSPSTAVLLS